MTKVIFTYGLEKDVDNFLRAAQSVNNPRPTALHQEFLERCGEPLERERVTAFLEEKRQKEDLRIDEKILRISEDWKTIETKFFDRCDELFGIKLPEPITAYISLNSRCTYRWKENYFFVSFYSDAWRLIIMHELFHFYTHRVFEEVIPAEKFNEIKESLTAILNLEFAELLNGRVDKGYPQHEELRLKISNLYKQGDSLREIVDKLLKPF